jgi:predicted PurR-regulated permease PerM
MMGDTPVLIPAGSPVTGQAEEDRATSPDPERAAATIPIVEPPPPRPIPWWETGPGRAALIVLVVFALAYTLQVTRELVLPIVIALLISIVLSPIAGWLRKLRLPHALAAGIVVTLFAGSVGAGVYALTDPAASWIERAPQTMREVQRKLRKIRLPMIQAQQAARQVEELANVDGQKAATQVTVKEASLARRVLTSMQKGLFYLAEIIVLVFFILAFGDAFVRKVVKIPARLRDKIHVVKILQEIQEEISHYLFTVACINAGLGAATAVAMWLLGMPNAILWGAMAAAFNFVPYLGSAVSLTVLTVVALITFESVAHALLVPAVFLALATIEGQIVNPIIVGKRLSLSPLVIVIALMIGAWVWGVVGVLMAVPILVMLKIYFSHNEHLAPYAEALGKD